MPDYRAQIAVADRWRIVALSLLCAGALGNLFDRLMSARGVVDFIDEWISAPYPQQRADRELILKGLPWLNAEAFRRFRKTFDAASDAQRAAIADDICSAAKSRPELETPVKFLITPARAFL